jgi:hypothetical protein
MVRIAARFTRRIVLSKGIKSLPLADILAVMEPCMVASSQGLAMAALMTIKNKAHRASNAFLFKRRGVRF